MEEDVFSQIPLPVHLGSGCGGARAQGPSLPSPLPEPPTLDRSRQVLREEEKEEMSLWERPRGPGKNQAGGGAAPVLPGLSAIAVGEPRGAGRGGEEGEEGERRRGRGKGKFAEEEPPLASDRPAGAGPPRRDGGGDLGSVRAFSFVPAQGQSKGGGVCGGLGGWGGGGVRLRAPCSRHFQLSGKNKTKPNPTKNRLKTRAEQPATPLLFSVTGCPPSSPGRPPQNREVAQKASHPCSRAGRAMSQICPLLPLRLS